MTKICVAGHRGMVGSAIVRQLLAQGHPLGDPAKAKQKLGWVPQITEHQMCQEMEASDLQEGKRHALLKVNGYEVKVSAE